MASDAVVDTSGPYPALWQTLPASLRNENADRYRMTPTEQAWIDGLAPRTPLVWTEANDQMAARFAWHAALRDSLRTESSA